MSFYFVFSLGGLVGKPVSHFYSVKALNLNREIKNNVFPIKLPIFTS